LFHSVGNFIIPTDFHSIILHHFSEGWRKTTKQFLMIFPFSSMIFPAIKLYSSPAFIHIYRFLLVDDM